MAEMKKRLRRGLAGFLALCMTITSFAGISWADEEISYPVTVKLEGRDLWESAQDAITNWAQVPLDEELDEEDTETAKFYDLFSETGVKGTLFEMALDYEFETEEDADAPEGADLQAFVRTGKKLTEAEAESYKLTGKEQIIFLFKNYSDATLKYQLHIDEKYTSVVKVRKYEEKAGTVVPETKPEVNGGQGTGGNNEVKVPENTEVTQPTEGESQTPPAEESQSQPAEEESQTPPAVEESQSQPAEEESQTPPVTDESQTPPAEESQSQPAAEESQTPPVAEESQSQPVVEESQTPPAADESQSQPAAEEIQTPPAVDESQSQPAAEEIQTPPAVDESQSQPAAEEIQTPPAADEGQSQPAEEVNPNSNTENNQSEILSMSRHETATLMAVDPDVRIIVSTPSQADATPSTADKLELDGKIIARESFEEGYNVTVFAIRLEDIPKSEEEGGYELLVEHDLEYDGRIYYDEQPVNIAEDLFDENMSYNFAQDVYNSETYHKGGLHLLTAEEELKVLKDAFEYNEETQKYEARVIIHYDLKEGWYVVDDRVEEEPQPVVSYRSSRLGAASALEKVPGIVTSSDEKYPDYITAAMAGDDQLHISSFHYTYQVVGEKKGHYHYSKSLGRDVCGAVDVGDIYADRGTHYVIIKEEAKQDEISYMRCDIYNKEDPEKTYFEVTFWEEGNPDLLMKTAVEKDYPVSSGLTEERQIPLKTSDGKDIDGWYLMSDTNKERKYSHDEVKAYIITGKTDFVASVKTDKLYHVKYMANDGKNEFHNKYNAPDILDSKDYKTSEKATILGSYKEYQHDQSGNKMLIGWSTNQKLTGNSQNIVKNKSKYDEIVKSDEFYKFGTQVTVSDKADSNGNLKLYPVWAEAADTVITITYKTDPAGAGVVDPKVEVVHWWEEIHGSTVTSTTPGYTFVGWEGTDDSEKLKFIPTEWKTATYTAYFKEVPPITINYAVENGELSRDSDEINPFLGTPEGTVATPNPGYAFDKWTYHLAGNTEELEVNPDWYSNDTEGKSTFKPQKVLVDGQLQYQAATYTAHFKLQTDGELVVKKNFSKEGSVSMEGLSQEQKPDAQISVTLSGVTENDNISYRIISGEENPDYKVKDVSDNNAIRKYEITLKDGESVTFSGINRNVKYTVKENLSANNYYKTRMISVGQTGKDLAYGEENEDSEKDGVSRDVTGDFLENNKQEIEFTNLAYGLKTMNPEETLRIRKKLITSDGEAATEKVDNVSFIFKIENKDTKSPAFGEVIYKTISIPAGNSQGEVTVDSLPVSECYEITEESHIRYQCLTDKVVVAINPENGSVDYKGSEPADAALFKNVKVSEGYFSDSYTLVNKMDLEKIEFDGEHYPGTSRQDPLKSLNRDSLPPALMGLGADSSKIFEDMNNGNNDLLSFSATSFGR